MGEYGDQESPKEIRNLPRYIALYAIFILLLLPSCGDIFTPNKETILLSASERAWFVTEIESYLLRDSLSQTEIFTLDHEWNALNILNFGDGLNREETHYEVRAQSFGSNRECYYILNIEAGYLSNGTRMRIQVNDMNITYNLSTRKLSSIYTPYFSDKFVYSTAIYYDTLIINNTPFTKVLEFKLLDFEDQWKDSTIVEFAIAKELGLIKYTMNEGTTMFRASEFR